jgi:hypothetical protein
MSRNKLQAAGEIPNTGIPSIFATQMTMSEQYEWHQSYLRRHRVSRRNFLYGSALMASAAGLGLSHASLRAHAQDAPLTVTNRRVGYGGDASSQLRMVAQLSRNPRNARVLVAHGPTPSLGATTVAEIRNLVTQIPDSDGGVLATEQFYAHVPIDGLPGHATHFYQWRTSDGFVSDIRSVTTALPAKRGGLHPFRFTMMGDQGTDTTPALPPGLARGVYDNAYYAPDNDPGVAHARNVLNQIISSRPAFHILAGDIAYADRSGLGRRAAYAPTKANPPVGFDLFNPFVWDTYFESIEESASATPWMFATGNHDMEAAYPLHGYGGHLARLTFPGNGPAICPSAYSFSYGNVAVVSLDANDVSYEIRANTGYSEGAQNDWVEQTLAGHRSDPAIDFIACFFHHCAYGTRAHGSDGGVRAAWTNLFDRYEVDLVLQGHNHVFERTDPIRAGNVVKVAPDNAVIYPDSDGTVYYTVGSGGRPRYAFREGEYETYRGNEISDTAVSDGYVWTEDGRPQDEVAAWSRVRFDNYAFLRIDVRPGALLSEMDVSAVDEYGREFDKLTFRRRVQAA